MGRMIGWIVMLAGSVGIGIGLGEWYFRLYLKAVPPSAMSSVNQSASHAVFLLYGLGAGVAIFVWTLLIASIAAMIAARRASPPQPAAATPANPPPPPR